MDKNNQKKKKKDSSKLIPGNENNSYLWMKN